MEDRRMGCREKDGMGTTLILGVTEWTLARVSHRAPGSSSFPYVLLGSPTWCLPVVLLLVLLIRFSQTSHGSHLLTPCPLCLYHLLHLKQELGDWLLTSRKQMSSCQKHSVPNEEATNLSLKGNEVGGSLVPSHCASATRDRTTHPSISCSLQWPSSVKGRMTGQDELAA